MILAHMLPILKGILERITHIWLLAWHVDVPHRLAMGHVSLRDISEERFVPTCACCIVALYGTI